MPTAVAEAAGEGATAFGVLSTLLQQHSSLQSEIAQDQRDITAGKARETTANQAVKQATSEVTRLQAELSKRDKTIADQTKKLAGAPKAPKTKASRLPSRRPSAPLCCTRSGICGTANCWRVWYPDAVRG